MLLKHGKLQELIGRPASSDGFTFIPAAVEMDRKMFRPSSFLGGLSPDRIPPVLRVAIEQTFDVAWVCARLPATFGIAPEAAQMDKALLAVSFVTVRDGSDEGIPFDVSDYHGKTSIAFSEAESDERLKQEIADAFWNVLLADPDELADFQSRVDHPGTGAWRVYGCEDGQPYFMDEIANVHRPAKRPNILSYQLPEKSGHATRHGALCVACILIGLLLLVLANHGLISNKESAAVESIMFCAMGALVFGLFWLFTKSDR